MSKFLPEKDGIAIYSNNLLDALNKNKANIETIGTMEAKADFNLDFSSSSLKKKLAKIVKKERFDLIHIQYIAPWYNRFLNLNLIKAMKAIRAIKIPIVVTLHEVQYPRKTCSIKDKIKFKVLQYIEKKVVKNADRVIVHTPGQKTFLQRRYRARNVETVFMGVHPKKHAAKRGKNLLFFGMMNYGKGIEYLIRAMKHLPDYKLKIRGRAVTEDYKRRLMNEAKGIKNVDLKFGWVSEKDKDKLYKWASILVMPYTWAPYQSAVLHDALSYSIPVVVTKVGAVWEVVAQYSMGKVIKPKDSKQIAEAIKKVNQKHKTFVTNIKKYHKDAKWKNIGLKTMEQYKKTIS